MTISRCILVGHVFLAAVISINAQPCSFNEGPVYKLEAVQSKSEGSQRILETNVFQTAGEPPRYTVVDQDVGLRSGGVIHRHLGDTVYLRAVLFPSDVGSDDNQWYLNGKPISGATNVLLVLTNLQESQTGTYSFHSSNPFGTHLASVRLELTKETLFITTGQLLSYDEEGTATAYLRMLMLGLSGKRYRIETTSDFLHWTPVTEVAGGPQWTGPTFRISLQERSRFFRVVELTDVATSP